MSDPTPISISIRRAQTVADYHACQDAQRRAWGIVDESYVVPLATMVGAQLHGGLVLGAFLPDGSAAGMSFAFLGRIHGRLCLYSQLTGVVPGFQSQGLGGRLKHAQREVARAEGIPCIAWAFDPLQAGNARFNLAKLGASAGRYVEDMYGPRTDALNAGMPTDRLIAEWEAEPAPRFAIDPGAVHRLPRLIEATVHPDGRIEPGAVDTSPSAPLALLEIPDDFPRLRRDDPGRAEAWRLAVNRAFRAAFAAGHRAVSVLRDDSQGVRRCFYVLRSPSS